MVGTSYEILLYLSYQHSTAERLGIHYQRLVRMRPRIASKNYDEQTISDMLLRLDCRCLREQVCIPAVIRDKDGHLWDEKSFVKNFLTDEICKKIRVEKFSTRTITSVELRRLSRIMRATIVQHRMILDSVWSYDPIPSEFDDNRLVQVRRIIGYDM